MGKKTTKLTYAHKQGVLYMRKEGFKPFINEWFEDVKFLGYEYPDGEYCPSIEVSNWDEVKDKLPKKFQPINVNDKSNELHPHHDVFVLI